MCFTGIGGGSGERFARTSIQSIWIKFGIFCAYNKTINYVISFRISILLNFKQNSTLTYPHAQKEVTGKKQIPYLYLIFFIEAFLI
jgi:hypothetical protein